MAFESLLAQASKENVNNNQKSDWVEVESRKLSEEEVEFFESAQVVRTMYGVRLAIKFKGIEKPVLKKIIAGCFVPVDTVVKADEIELVHLNYTGTENIDRKDCERVRIKKEYKFNFHTSLLRR